MRHLSAYPFRLARSFPRLRPTPSGNTSEFSLNRTVANGNDAPTLDATKNPALIAISEDAGTPSGVVGTLVASLVDFATPNGQVDNVTDPDPGGAAGHRGDGGGYDQRHMVVFDQQRHELARSRRGEQRQRATAGGGCRYASLLPAQRQLQRYNGSRYYVPSLGPGQRHGRRDSRRKQPASTVLDHSSVLFFPTATTTAPRTGPVTGWKTTTPAFPQRGATLCQRRAA